MNPAKPHLDRVDVNARINITRPQGGSYEGKIKIQIYDEDSRVAIFEGTITLANFASAITGLSDQSISGFASTAVYALGKCRVYERRTVVLPKDLGYRNESKWVEANCQEEGWFVDSYLGAQSSFSYNKDGTRNAHYRVFKYVEKDSS